MLEFPNMYGVKAFLIFLGFMIVACGFLAGVFALWREYRRGRVGIRDAIVLSAFALVWVVVVSSGYLRNARFHYDLSRLSAADVYSIQIGHHDFRDQQTIDDIVGALRRARWFEVNHRGWGDSIPMILRRRSNDVMRVEVALYFREPGAIVGPASGKGLDYSGAHAFAPELRQALERYGVKLPDCDTAYRKPCTADQLNP